MGQYRVFSLADAIERAQMANMRDAQFQQYQEQVGAERGLADILANSIVTTGGSPEVREQVPYVDDQAEFMGRPTPPGLGTMEKITPAVPGRTEISYDKAFQNLQIIKDPHIRSKAMLELQKMREASELKRMDIAAKMREKESDPYKNYNAQISAGMSGEGDPRNFAGLYQERTGRMPTRQQVMDMYREHWGKIQPLQFGPEGAPAIPRGGNPSSPYPIPNPKIIPNEIGKEIRQISSNTETVESLNKDFKPNYGGHPITRDWQRNINAMFGKDMGAYDFWSRHAALQNMTRHELFGAALTDKEWNEWRAADINPGMSPQAIRQNLATRERLMRKAANKLLSGYKTEKYDQDMLLRFSGGRRDLIEPFTYYDETPPVAAPPSQPSAPQTGWGIRKIN